MTHPRNAIRSRLIVILTGLTTTGNRVFSSHKYPLQSAELPGLNVFSETEEVEESANNRVFGRRLTLLIEANVKSSTGAIDDALDGIAEEVEAAVEADPTLAGTALFTKLISTEFEFNTESNQPLGVMSMRYEVFYRTE